MHFSQIKNWVASTADQPTWRDGLGGSDRTYTFVAVPHHSEDGYKAIVAGRAYGNYCKVKFYPTALGVGIEPRQLMALGFTVSANREHYVSYSATIPKLVELLESLDKGVWQVCPTDNLKGVLLGYPNEEGRQSSRSRHPTDLDFTQPKAEDFESKTELPAELQG